MLTIRNLSKSFSGTEVLSRISLQVDEGEFIALVGASGSGKTTLLRCLSLREKWTEGQYIYNGKEITELNLLQQLKFRKHWAFAEEKKRLNPRTTALKNVLGARWQQLPIWRLITRSVGMEEHMTGMDALEKVGLLDKAKMKVEKLSGGEQQRVAMAMAMVKGATILVADEPVAGLDPHRAEQLMQDLRDVCRSAGVTIICSLHKIELAERFATRIWGINRGKIVVDTQNRRLTQREKDMIFA
ncbi:phosphonate ABC transporter ATP-binding protein [Paenibacillus cymbidii]|uniref:phosphonate ABC transporter ATP-binding protein n=1 Tax=Paenibacillus cymbidii TaxID=1639034 RepID=UPI00107FE9FF|nr:ATP-binding cassette domain-containing protein [Paenibacillus cymbidii]